MSRPLLDREYERCLVGTAAAMSPFCASCNRTINQIIARAADGEIQNDELAEMVGLTTTAVEQRKSRMQRAKRMPGVVPGRPSPHRQLPTSERGPGGKTAGGGEGGRFSLKVAS